MSQVLANALTEKWGSGTDLSDYPTYRPLERMYVHNRQQVSRNRDKYVSKPGTPMPWTSETVVLKIYETVDVTRRFDVQRLEQWLSVLRRRPGDEVFSALFGVFRSIDRPRTRYLDQEYAGHLLVSLKPPCPPDVEGTIKRVIGNWDYSIEQLPWYFVAAVGRDAILRVLDRLLTQCTSEEELRANETFRYWIRISHSAKDNSTPR
jgi:hypothetical protein